MHTSLEWPRAYHRLITTGPLSSAPSSLSLSLSLSPFRRVTTTSSSLRFSRVSWQLAGNWLPQQARSRVIVPQPSFFSSHSHRSESPCNPVPCTFQSCQDRASSMRTTTSQIHHRRARWLPAMFYQLSASLSLEHR